MLSYDPEGNRTLRYVWTDADADGEVDERERSEITEYECDHRNRLVSVTERDTETGPATQIVEHTYDYLNRWVARAVDSDGDGSLGFEDTYFVYDGTPGAVSLDRSAVTTDNVGQIVLQFDEDAQGDAQLTHRYLWGPAVDQILADEAVTSLATPGDVLWPLPDHLGTVRDLAQRDPSTGETTIANHRTFDSYGNLLTETNPALDHLFAFTGRALDASTALQNNLNRWYDAEVGEWLSQDPIGFSAGDTNVYRYVRNAALDHNDPSGLIDATSPNVPSFLPGRWKVSIRVYTGDAIGHAWIYFENVDNPNLRHSISSWKAGFAPDTPAPGTHWDNDIDRLPFHVGRYVIVTNPKICKNNDWSVFGNTCASYAAYCWAQYAPGDDLPITESISPAGLAAAIGARNEGVTHARTRWLDYMRACILGGGMPPY